MIKNNLTDDEKLYLQQLFWDHEKKINEKLNAELTILSKYKKDLASNYEQVRSYQNTLVGCMKDIIQNQESLYMMMKHLIKAITGKYPEHEDRIVAVDQTND